MTEFSLADLVTNLKPKLVVELGTGDGATAARVMDVLPADSKLICVNWPNPPSGDDPVRYLSRVMGDSRLTVILGDSRDVEVVTKIPDGIDLLHIDSTHTFECAIMEWELYEPKLADNAIVVFDDLDHNDMMKFWDEVIVLWGERRTVRDGRVGILRYKR